MKDKITTKKPIKKTKENVNNKKPVGREPKYQPWMDSVAKALAKEGKIDSYIYKVLGITEPTGISYKKKYPNFFKSLSEGKAEPNKQVETKLFELANGFEYEEEQAIVVSDGSQIGSHIEKIKVKKILQPNLGAQKYWLNNRKPIDKNPDDGWGDRTKIELGNADNEPFIIEIK